MALKRGNDIKLSIDLDTDNQLAKDLYHQFNEYHSMNIWTDKEIETGFYNGVLESIQNPTPPVALPENVFKFTPSSADKCSRELYYKFTNIPKDEEVQYPYRKRWTRNSTLVHEGTQRDLLYMEKYLKDPNFVVLRTPDGKPAWEENIKKTVIIEHKGTKIAMTGMMDGQLVYTPTGEIVGFEFKTKSNTVAQVGTYKLKDAGESHKKQCVAYSIMWDIHTYIIMYEAVAKDNWGKGEEARTDIRTFEFNVTPDMTEEMLDRFVSIVKAVEDGNAPSRETDKCMFCSYKTHCGGDK